MAFHLAAAVGVQLIVDKPLESLATNIRGSEIYGKNTSDKLGEEDDRILGSPLTSGSQAQAA